MGAIAERIAGAQLTQVLSLARKAERGLRFANYDALWRWSVADIEAFWAAIWDCFEVISDITRVSSRRKPCVAGSKVRAPITPNRLRFEGNAKTWAK